MIHSRTDHYFSNSHLVLLLAYHRLATSGVLSARVLAVAVGVHDAGAWPSSFNDRWDVADHANRYALVRSFLVIFVLVVIIFIILFSDVLSRHHSHAQETHAKEHAAVVIQLLLFVFVPSLLPDSQPVHVSLLG